MPVTRALGRGGERYATRAVLAADLVGKAALVALLADEAKEDPLLGQNGRELGLRGNTFPISPGMLIEYQSYFPLTLCFLTR